MSELHTIDFNGFGVNIVSDYKRGAISLQFDASGCRVGTIEPVLKAITRRFGRGIWAQLSRWAGGQGDALLVTSRPQPHPDSPDVIRVEMAVREGERMDSALAALMAFFRQQPGYRRTLGPPLDRDDVRGPVRRGIGDASRAAQDALRQMLERGRRKEPGT